MIGQDNGSGGLTARAAAVSTTVRDGATLRELAAAQSEPAEAKLSVGFILLNEFTLVAFSGVVDALRIAGDELDNSRRVECRWTRTHARQPDAPAALRRPPGSARSGSRWSGAPWQ